MLTFVKAVVPLFESVTVNTEVPLTTTLLGLNAAVAAIELFNVALSVLALVLTPVTDVVPLANEIFEETNVSVQGPPAVV